MKLTCGGCTNTWSGLSRAHCGGCHITLNGMALFDLHRSPEGPHGTCLDPAEIVDRNGEHRMFLRDGIWCGPEAPEELKARWLELREQKEAAA